MFIYLIKYRNDRQRDFIQNVRRKLTQLFFHYWKFVEKALSGFSVKFLATSSWTLRWTDRERTWGCHTRLPLHARSCTGVQSDQSKYTLYNSLNAIFGNNLFFYRLHCDAQTPSSLIVVVATSWWLLRSAVGGAAGEI